jgi:mono/diheme cytochrome c family protein
MKRNYVTAGVVAVIALGVGYWWISYLDAPSGQSDSNVSKNQPALSAMARAGEGLFNAKCAVCHGANAAGTNQGPPLVHKIYEPSHHGDLAFQRAARSGVRAHHWRFGNMPPVAGITQDDVTKITRYVREMQRAHGIF